MLSMNTRKLPESTLHPYQPGGVRGRLSEKAATHPLVWRLGNEPSEISFECGCDMIAFENLVIEYDTYH